MWHEMFIVQVPVLEKIVRTVLVYATIVLLFRLTGRRGLAQLNTLDFTVLFLLSNVVQNAVIGNDNSVTGGAIGAVTLVATDAALNRWIARSSWAARVLEGNPTTLISDGKLTTKLMGCLQAAERRRHSCRTSGSRPSSRLPLCPLATSSACGLRP
jgi:uncharacterized membrane protein YcaP (DUF421 family)